MSENHDAIIAGGGVAGAAAAAALAQLDYRVLVVEPGLDHSRRLAGELIHPPGVADLDSLGLLSSLQNAGAVPVRGFAMVAQHTQVLPYASTSGLMTSGLAIEHSLLAGAMLDAVEKLPNVTVWRGSRVTGVNLSDTEYAGVTVGYENRQSPLRARLLVAADGRSSAVRRLAGIPHKQRHLSNMVGFLLTGSRLPHPGLGHVFAGGPSPVLAYDISESQTRVMFDVPLSGDISSHVRALPEALRRDVEQAMTTQAPLRAANDCVIPATVVKNRFVCVGDAGGCCHPVSATGLTACVRDAVLLRDVLQSATGDIPKALPRYAALRKSPQRTRMAGAELLYDVLRAETPEMILLREGLLRYWQRSDRGRVSTMALLSTEDHRFSSVVREYLQVCRYALPSLVRLNGRGRAMVGLSRTLLRFLEYA